MDPQNAHTRRNSRTAAQDEGALMKANMETGSANGQYILVEFYILESCGEVIGVGQSHMCINVLFSASLLKDKTNGRI